MNDHLTEKRPAPGRRISIALAVAVHVILAIFLIYGVRWQSQPPAAVEVELVRAMPVSAVEPPKPAPPPKPEPKPEPAPEPKVEPRPEPPPPAKPDIVVKKEKPKPVPKEAPPPKWNPFQQQVLEEEKRAAEQKQIAARLAADQQQLDAQKAAQAAAARDKALAEYGDRIRAKIRASIVLPPDIKGNPAAVFEVTQLPSGDVIDVRRVKPSGHAAYDDAVERAIRKSSPLPKPRDPSDFERTLKLTFCPNESGCN